MQAAMLDDLASAIPDLDEHAAARARARIDAKTKPRGSLGRLEEIFCRLAAITGREPPEPARKAIVVMAGDHGVVEEGVSAYPQEVTAQMLLNFAAGGAAVNQLARVAGARLLVLDMGTVRATGAAGVRQVRIGAGTRNFTREPAMTREACESAVRAGAAIADELVGGGVGLIGLGEMGIGNSTAASALTAAFTGLAPQEVTGRGTGVDDAGWRRKVDAIRRGLELHGGGDALDTLARLGGFEIAGLCGVVLGAASRRVPVVVDGFTATCAALCAARIAPRSAGYLLPSHRSVEVGHRALLAALRLDPLFDLGMRLGEGTGAALAMTIIDAAVALGDMATFAEARVSDTGR
jgi:nicotinate-nucleotide--dimethylbenzimidazole phosphoribosyltransferase